MTQKSPCIVLEKDRKDLKCLEFICKQMYVQWMRIKKSMVECIVLLMYITLLLTYLLALNITTKNASNLSVFAVSFLS